MEKPGRFRKESGLNEHVGRHKNATGPPYHLYDKEVFAKATEVMGSEAAAKVWMNEPCIGLGNKKPVDLVRTSAGAAAVKTYLNQIEPGVYA